MVDRQLASRRASETSIRRSINSEIIPNVKKTLKEAVIALESSTKAGSTSDAHGDEDDDGKKKTKAFDLK